MVDPDRRKQLEESLRDAIQQGEEIAFRDPEVKDMIESLRRMYEDDKGVLFSALGLGAPAKRPDPSQRVKLPNSRIPELIHLLDTVAKRQSAKAKGRFIPPYRSPTTTPSPKSAAHPSQKSPSSLPRHSSPSVDAPVTASNTEKRSNPGEYTGRRAIQLIEEEIRQAQAMLELITRDRDAIRMRKGSYAIPMNRLKAERLLRELPSKIVYLEEKKGLLEENNS